MFNNFFFERTEKLPAPAFIRPVDNGEFSIQDIGVAADGDYTIEVATDAEFTNVIETVNSKDLDLKTLIANNGEELFIRAAVDNGVKASGYSSMKVTYYTQPPQTVLGGPADSFVSDSFTISFTYSTSEFATIYQIQIAEENTFTDSPIEFESDQDKYDADLSSLSLFTPYFWRVRAVNNNVYGDWSETRSFTIEMI